MNKYYFYCRKSSEQEDRQVLSLDSQFRELTSLSKKLKIEFNANNIIRESYSAKNPGRPLFNKMMESIEKGESNTIVAWSPDRLSRNSMDTGKLVYFLDIGKLSAIITPSQTFTSSPNDKFLFGLLCSTAKLENDNKGLNVKEGLKTKAINGWLPSGCKPGYMNDKYGEKGNKTLPVDPIRFPLIKQAWDLMLTGVYSPPQILRKLNNEWGYRSAKQRRMGGKPMSRSKIYQIFTDTFYYGEFEYPTKSGKWYNGKHTPMITREQFERVQILLGIKGRPRPIIHEFFATGLIRCGECNCMITAEEKLQVICSTCKTKFASRNRTACIKCKTQIENMIKPTLLRYVYYHCTKKKNPNCSQGSIQEKNLVKQIDEVLSHVQISERFKNWAIKYLNEAYDKEAETRNVSQISLQNAYNDTVKRIDNLVKLLISPQNTDKSLLSEEEFKNQKESLLKEKTNIQEKLGDVDGRVNKWLELSEKTFKFACYAKYWFDHGDLMTKRQILSGLGSNLILKDKLLIPDVQNPLFLIVDIKDNEETISSEFEPKEKIDLPIQLEELWSQNIQMLPQPWITLTIDFPSIIQAFQDIRYIGELRQRWNEIKKLQTAPSLRLT